MPGGPTRASTKRPKGRGRPSALTEENVKAIETALFARLASHSEIAEEIGIDVSTLQRWLSRGRREFETGKTTKTGAPTDYSNFYQRYSAAARRAKGLLVGRVVADRSSKMALKILQARYPDWAPKQHVTVQDAGPRTSPRDAFIARMAAIEKRLEQSSRLQEQSGRPVDDETASAAIAAKT